MPGLYLVPKRAPESPAHIRSAAAAPLPQLAAIDRAAAQLQQACARLAGETQRALQVAAKLQAGTENFIAAWNAAHPQHQIQRCRGVSTEPACARYTTDPQALCDACRSRGAK